MKDKTLHLMIDLGVEFQKIKKPYNEMIKKVFTMEDKTDLYISVYRVDL